MPQNVRKYPWISFKVDLRVLPYTTWVELGECMSKCEHISRIPLTPFVAEEMHKIYLAKGSRATTAIEGNTLSEEEVRDIIDEKLALPPSREYLGQEVDNIIRLCNEITNVVTDGKDFLITSGEISRYNGVVLEKMSHPDHVVPGKFRTYPVVVGGYRAVDHRDVAQLMNRLCQWLNGEDFRISGISPVMRGIIKAVIAHLYIAWIHPFGDGNGRTARILEFAILLSSGIPSPTAHLLSNHYNTTRSEYYSQLDSASKKRDVCGFLSYAIQGFRDGLVEQLEYIFQQVLEISWENFVYETLKRHKQTEKTRKRRTSLVLELSKRTEPMLVDSLVAMSQDTVEAYAKKSHMTLVRDLDELVRLDLVEKTPNGYRAKKNRMRAFLPKRIEPVVEPQPPSY